MKTKIKKLCATIVTVILSVICAGCGDLSALKTKYIAELDAYYQEIEAMNLEYSTIFIQAELEKGKENINATTNSLDMLMKTTQAKQRMQGFILPLKKVAIFKQAHSDARHISLEHTGVLYYFGKFDDVHAVIMKMDVPVIATTTQSIAGYEFYIVPGITSVIHNGMYYPLSEAYNKHIVSLEQVKKIHIFNQLMKKEYMGDLL